MSEKTCFVVMPIRKFGTPEYAHFRAIFEQIKPTIEASGYSVIRADDVQRTGAITKDIVSRLAQSDLLVADLTDLNPNVLYELGVRHALRGTGTIMILDERRTPEIPFDLSAYRVIKFSGDLTGIEPLKSALAMFLNELADRDVSRRDNPVHDWFPALPANVLDDASQSSVGDLRRNIKELQNRIDQYERALGSKLPERTTDNSPISAVLSAISDAEDGLLPVTVMDDLRKAFEERNVVSFLQKVRIVIERKVRLPSTSFISLAHNAMVLDLESVAAAIFEQASEFYPSDRNLKRNHLARLAHSEAAADRDRARREIADLLTLEVQEDAVRVREPRRLVEDPGFVGLLLDAYHRDGLDREALRIIEKLVEMFPQRSSLLRNFGRALERLGNLEQAMKQYRAAIVTADVDDTSAVWLGSTLHNQDQNVRAAEVYALGCLLDPADGANFAHLADELSTCLASHDSPLPVPPGLILPGGIGSTEVLGIVECAVSCPNVDAAISDRLRRAINRLDSSEPSLSDAIGRAQRVARVKSLYEALRTSLTKAGDEYDFQLRYT